jgi:hypothetical protein
MQQVARGYNASRSLVVFSYHGGLYENPKRLLYNKHVMSINEKYCKRWAACLPACPSACLPVCLPSLVHCRRRGHSPLWWCWQQGLVVVLPKVCHGAITS